MGLNFNNNSIRTNLAPCKRTRHHLRGSRSALIPRSRLDATLWRRTLRQCNQQWMSPSTVQSCCSLIEAWERRACDKVGIRVISRRSFYEIGDHACVYNILIIESALILRKFSKDWLRSNVEEMKFKRHYLSSRKYKIIILYCRARNAGRWKSTHDINLFC